MIRLNLHQTGNEVKLLQNLLNDAGYPLPLSGDFDPATAQAVKDFQSKYQLVPDGIVYTQTWTTLLCQGTNVIPGSAHQLKGEEITELAAQLGIEPAVIRAVMAVESSGGGYWSNGCLKMLFEGHIFWQELQRRGIDPRRLALGNEDILSPSWTTRYYKRGIAEYERLHKAIALGQGSTADRIADAAFAAASWGMFQIMGYHYQALGCNDVITLIASMKRSEGDQLRLFAAFIRVNGLLKYLRDKDWAAFAYRYNGAAFANNQYDLQLKKFYLQYA